MTLPQFTPKQQAIIDSLHPALRPGILAICAEVPVVPFCGFRSLDEQARLYAQGRTKPGPKVTWALPGSSPHNFNPPTASLDDGALACDLIIDVTRVKVAMSTWQGKQYPNAWDDSTVAARAIWTAIGVAARKAGLEWGGDWSNKPDRPHVELKNWRSFVRTDLKARATVAKGSK